MSKKKTKVCPRCGNSGLALRMWPIPRGFGKSAFIPCPDCIGKTMPILVKVNIDDLIGEEEKSC